VAKWRVVTQVTVIAHTIVEADDADTAREIASQRPVHLMGFAEEEDSFIIEEADGEPDCFTVEAVRG
jgi:uncharacterized protein YciI